HRDRLAGGVSLGLVIANGSPYFGGVPGACLVDSQVSPYGPRIRSQNPRRSGGLDARTTERYAMPRRNSLISRLRLGRAWDEWDENGDGEDTVAPVPVPESTKTRSRRRRAAVAMTFSALFVAGAAFSATAGDQVRSSLEDSAVS